MSSPGLSQEMIALACKRFQSHILIMKVIIDPSIVVDLVQSFAVILLTNYRSYHGYVFKFDRASF